MSQIRHAVTFLSFATVLSLTATLSSAQTKTATVAQPVVNEPAANVATETAEPAPALQPVPIPTTKETAEADYRPVPMTEEEMAAHDLDNPKKEGALTLANLDRTIPLSPDPALPNYYYYHNQRVALPFDVNRLAVRVVAGVDLRDAVALTSDRLGIEASSAEPTAIDGWTLITVTQPLIDMADANHRIESLLDAGQIEFASPVFHSLAIPGGWVVFGPDILIRFKPEHAAQAHDSMNQLAADFQITEENLGGMAGAFKLRGSPKNGIAVLAQANRLAEDPRVKWAEPDALFTGTSGIWPNDAERDNLWAINNTGQNVNGVIGTDDMDMDGIEAWNITRGATSVRVLIIDNGVEQTHADLNQNAGRDFSDGTATGTAGGGPVNMCDNHGTAVAGCVSASFNNGIGVVGIAPNCRSVSARCMVSNVPCDGNWTAFGSWTVNALGWARDQGIQVTNNSNGYGFTSDAIDDAYLDTYNDGLTHFASNGNSGASSIAYPASADTVNGVCNIQQDGTRNPSSQFGTGTDFCAPGTNIRTTDRTGGAGYGSTDYAWVNGTSFASPYCAGVAALVKTAHPNWAPINIETAMKSGATDLGAFSYDTTFGWGLVNAHRSNTIFGPSNDECTNPIVITGTSYNPGSIFTYNATTSDYFEPDENCEWNNNGVSNSVWYSYTAPANGTIDLNTWGSSYDTVISVFNGCNSYIGASPFWWATQIACNDDINGTLQSEVLGVQVTGGSEYLIKVSDYNTSPGGGELFVDLYFHYGPPANDYCPNRTMIPATPGAYTMPAVYTAPATLSPATCTEPWEYFCGHPDGNSNSVWYGFVPTVSGTLSMNTFGSDYDTVLTIFNGAGFSNPCGEFWQGQDGPQCVDPSDFGYYDCNDDSYDGTWYYQSMINDYPVTAGWPYLIKISDYNPAPGGGWLVLNTGFNAAAPAQGDVNNDGLVDFVDVQFMVDALIDPENCPMCNLAQADMNDDGFADGLDLQPFVDMLMGG